MLILPAAAIGKWLDSYKRSCILYYDLEPSAVRAIEGMTKIIDQLSVCEHTWHIKSSGEINDLVNWKRHAGASDLIDRNETKFIYKLPKIINSNITPPSIKVGSQTLYFFPDVLLVEDKRMMGAVAYQNLICERYSRNFIEDGMVPRDTEIVGETWKHPNKNGGPDRRFSNNYRIPVCLYENLCFSSESGLNELISFSKPDATKLLVKFLRLLPNTIADKAVVPKTGR